MKQLFTGALFSLSFNFALGQVSVIAATGGTALSTASYAFLGDIVIGESLGTDIGGTATVTTYFELKVPTGYRFYVPSGSSDPFPIVPTKKGQDVSGFFNRTHSDTILKFGVDLFSNQGRLGDTLRISGIRVKAVNDTAATDKIVWVATTESQYGDINLTGATMQLTNFGTLSTREVTSGLPEEDWNGIAVYPNPAGAYVCVAVNTEVTACKLYTAQASLIYQQASSGTAIEINMGSLPPGIYFLHAQMRSGRQVIKKIVKN